MVTCLRVRQPPAQEAAWPPAQEALCRAIMYITFLDRHLRFKLSLKVVARGICSSLLPNHMLSRNKRPYEEAQVPRAKRLHHNLRDLRGSNALSGRRLQTVINDAVDSGSRGFSHRDVREPTSKNLARDQRTRFLKKNQWPELYYAPIRVKNLRDDTIVTEQVAFLLPHEILECLHRFSVGDKMFETARMDPKSQEHLEFCKREAGVDKMVGCGIHGDGVPCNWDRSKSVETVSTNLPGLSGAFAGLRVPNVAIPHDLMCEDTWDDVMEVLSWSWKHAAAGVRPTARHDESAWKGSDKTRRKKQGEPLPIRAAVVEMRGDWKYYAECFHFRQWNSKEGICWKCTCRRDQVIRI